MVSILWNDKSLHQTDCRISESLCVICLALPWTNLSGQPVMRLSRNWGRRPPFVCTSWCVVLFIRGHHLVGLLDNGHCCINAVALKPLCQVRDQLPAFWEIHWGIDFTFHLPGGSFVKSPARIFSKHFFSRYGTPSWLPCWGVTFEPWSSFWPLLSQATSCKLEVLSCFGWNAQLWPT